MRNTKFLTGFLSILLVLALSHVAEARVGGGRSSGFRGSRGFAPRQAAPNTAPSQPRPANPGTFGAPMGSPGGSPFMRGVMGGVAGGFLGSMLARSMGYGGDNQMQGSGGGVGILEILLLAGLGIFLFRKFMGSRQQYTSLETSKTQALATERGNNESDYAQTLERFDASFDLTRFKEQRMDDFLKIQSSWNTRDLNPVQNLLAPEIRETLDSDISELKRVRQINKLENIAVRGSDLTESWHENGKEYATLNFRAQLLDYTIDEVSQNVVSGDRSQPVKFEEEWTFVRNCIESVSATNPWKLSAISNS